MRHPYNMYDAYINIDDITISKIGMTDFTETHLQSKIQEAICTGIRDGLAKIGIAEEIPTVSVHTSVWATEDDWISCESILPPYGESVLVCLEDGTRCMTNRTERDYSKDKYDFVHIAIAKDAMYWQPLPPTPQRVKPIHKFKDSYTK